MTENQKSNSENPIDIEDLKEQGIRSDSAGSMTPGSKKRRKAGGYQYEFGAEITQGMDLEKTFSAVRDLDVDAMGKNKSGFDLNLFRKK